MIDFTGMADDEMWDRLDREDRHRSQILAEMDGRIIDLNAVNAEVDRRMMEEDANV